MVTDTYPVEHYRTMTTDSNQIDRRGTFGYTFKKTFYVLVSLGILVVIPGISLLLMLGIFNAILFGAQ